MIYARAQQENRPFHEVLDYYLELIRKLHIRTYAYLGEMRASTNPLAYCEGGFYGGQLLVKGVGGAHIGEIAPGGLQIVVDPGDTCFLQLFILRLVQETEGGADQTAGFFPDPLDGQAHPVHLPIV